MDGLKAHLGVMRNAYERFKLCCGNLLELTTRQADLFAGLSAEGKEKYAKEHKLASASAQAYVQTPFSFISFPHVFSIYVFHVQQMLLF